MTSIGKSPRTLEPRSTRQGRAAADALARYYDLDTRDDLGDVELYRALAARTGDPVLELAVGSGRIAMALASDGHRVVGVDRDPAMLARAAAGWSAGRRRRRGSGELELVECDLGSVELDERFGLAILALNSLLLLADGERQREAFRALARHLRPKGLAVVDIWLPGAEDLALYDGRLIHEWTRDDPDTGERVAKSGSATYDPATAAVELHTFFDAWPSPAGGLHRTERVDRLRLVGADELRSMADAAGLAVETLAGDYQLGSFGPGAERAVLIAGLV